MLEKIKKLGFLLTIFLGSLYLLFFISAPVYSNQAEWTIMVYMDADNNLEPFAIADFLEMAQVGSTDEVNIVVQLDRIPGEDSSYDDWTDCKRFYVEKGMEPTPNNAVQDLGEIDMASPDELTGFISWATTNYPAEKYMLVLWNHGDGWRERKFAPFRGIIWDDTNGTYFDIPGLVQALDNAPKIDIIAFDACLMAMIEVAYEISHGVSPPPDYMVGSEESEPGPGWPYTDILTELVSSPTMSPREFASLIPAEFVGWYHDNNHSQKYFTTQSAVDLNNLSTLVTKVDELAEALMASSYQSAIQSAFDKAQYYGNGDYIDLYDLAEIIYEDVPDCQSEASTVMAYLENTVVAESHSSIPESTVKDSHGLSIYYETPPDPDSKGYSNLAFAQNTHWDELLLKMSIGGPVNLIAGEGFNGIVPLTWDPVGEPLYYNIYRSETSAGPFDLIASVDTTTRKYEDNEDYLDADVTNGTTYYYKIGAVFLEGGQEKEYDSEIVSAMPSSTGQVINSGYTSSPPQLNGRLESGEWGNATVQQIELNGTEGISPIRMLVMNDESYLYIALDDENFTSPSDCNDFYIFFDADNDGLWNSDGSEGYFDIWFWNSLGVDFYGITGEYPDNIEQTDAQEATGVSVAVSMGSGHLQYEIRINLQTSNLKANPGDTIGLWVANWDDFTPGHYYYKKYDGAWPLGSIWVAPRSYGKLVLATSTQAPPEISHHEVTLATAGESLPITADITSSAGISRATVYFRKGGEETYTSVPMQSGSTYRATIPSTHVTERGLEYYIEVEDVLGQIVTSPATNPQTSPYTVRVKTSSLSFPFSTQKKKWQMISVPGELDDPSPNSILVDDLGTQDDTKWKLYHWNTANGSYDEYPDVPDFTPGRSFWLITKTSKSLDVENITSVDTSKDYSISLASGWTQIACPFAFSVDLDDVKVKKDSEIVSIKEAAGRGWVRDIIWYWDKDSYIYYQAPSGTLEPWKGYWFKALTPCTLLVPPVESSDKTKLSSTTSKSEESFLQITAKVEDLKDTYNFIGLSDKAKDTYDRLDIDEAPAISPYISLYFPHEDWGKNSGLYTQDIKKKNLKKDKITWLFEVKTSEPGKDVTLEWKNTQAIPETYSLFLTDEDENILVNMREVSSYSFTMQGEKERFKILAVKQESSYKKLTLEDVGNYPNPVHSDRTTILFYLGKEAQVTIKIYTISGELVKTLIRDKLCPEGQNEEVWDLRNDQGEKVAHGIYLMLIKAKASKEVVVKKGKIALID